MFHDKTGVGNEETYGRLAQAISKPLLLAMSFWIKESVRGVFASAGAKSDRSVNAQARIG